MKINYSEAKINFLKYLASKTNVDFDKLKDVSIFSYSNDFKDFMSSEYGLDDSIFNLNLEEILAMQISDGKIIDNDDNEENDFAFEFLNDFLSDDKVKATVDADGNGEISKEEMQNFFSTVSGLDGQTSDVSLSDVNNAFAQIQNGQFKLGATPETPETPESPSSPGSPSSPSSPTNPTTPTDPTTPDDKGGEEVQEKDLTKLTVKELTEERSSAQTSRDEQLDVLSQISKDEGPVADLKKAVDETFNKFNEELAKQDSALAEEFKAAKSDRETKEKAVEENDSAIAKKTAEKSDAQADLDNATKNVESLTSSIESLNSQKNSAETEEEKSAIQGKIDRANEQLRQAEDDKKAAQERLDKATDELSELEGKTSELQAALDSAKQHEEEVESKVNEVANKDPESVLSGLKGLYDKAKETYETQKATAIADAKKVIGEQQAYIDKINAQIPETQKAENEREFSPDTEEKAIEDKIASLGGNAKDLKIEKAADGSFKVTETTQDGVEVKYTFDKDGNITSYQDGIGTFTANGESTTIQSDMLRKWAKNIGSYNIDAKLEDIVAQIRQSTPQAESLINAALGSYQASGLVGQTDICVKYANYVLTQFGSPIGQYSKDVKANNPEKSLSEAKTGDVYNNDRHIGIVLLHITDRNGKEIFLTADGTNGGTTLNVRDGKDESLAKKARIFQGLK